MENKKNIWLLPTDNPSCEKIEVVLDVIKHIPWDKELESKYDFEKGYPITDYRITIPKEESKQTDEIEIYKP